MTLREIVFRIYVTIFVVAVAVGGGIFLSAPLREQGFPLLHWAWQIALPKIILIAWNDPLYLLAAVIIFSLIWCIPWEWFGDEKDDQDGDDENTEVRRGRPLLNSSHANRKAYQELTRQIASRQRGRKGKRK